MLDVAKKSIKDLWTAFRQGWPLTWMSLVGGLQVLLVLVSLLAVLGGPFGITRIGNPIAEVMAWVAWGITIGFLAISLGLTPYRGQKRITQLVEQAATEAEKNLTDLYHAAAPWKQFHDAQEGHESDWIRLLVEDIDLFQRQSSPPDVVYVKFQLDSGLVFEFKPYRVELRLHVSGAGPIESWELTPAPNLRAGKRTQLDTKQLPIKGDRLQSAVDEARQRGVAPARLEVHMTLRQGDSPVSMTSEERKYVVG